jgi:1,4-alpha-glucan branching enzyme
MSIYECHLGSWKGKIGDRYPSYEEVADYLIPLRQRPWLYPCRNHADHPISLRWFLGLSGDGILFGRFSRYGNPKQLMSFVDRCHKPASA